MSITIANAPCSWGVDYADAPDNPTPEAVFSGISQAGYAYAELGPYGFASTQPEALGALMRENGLSLVGGFLFEPLHDPAAHEAIKAKTERMLPLLSQAGATRLVLIDHISPARERTAGRATDAPRLDAEAFAQMTAFCRTLAKMASDANLAAVLHHHAASYVEFADEIDAVMDAVPELSLCIDTGHAAFCRIDPVGLAHRYGRRVKHLHLKDIDSVIHAGVLRDGCGFDEAVARGVFVPLGEGIVDFARFADALQDAGYDGFATVEQDIEPDPEAPEIPVAAARQSREYLTRTHPAYITAPADRL